MREATIATSLLIDFLGFLGRRGLDAETVCRAAQIDPDSSISMIWPRRLDNEPAHFWLRQLVRESVSVA